jgi:hypothetical protein
MSLIFKHGFDYNPFNKEIKVKKVKEKEKFTQKLSGFTNLNSLNINYDNSDVDNEIIENVTIKKTFYSVNRLVQFSRFLELFFGTYLNKEI